MEVIPRPTNVWKDKQGQQHGTTQPQCDTKDSVLGTEEPGNCSNLVSWGSEGSGAWHSLLTLASNTWRRGPWRRHGVEKVQK